jgi:hypothetical protein
MPRADGLTPQTRRIIAVLRECGDWVSRAELANALGKLKLVNYDLGLIEKMMAKGLIVSRRRRTVQKTVIYEYRAKSSGM